MFTSYKGCLMRWEKVVSYVTCQVPQPLRSIQLVILTVTHNILTNKKLNTNDLCCKRCDFKKKVWNISWQHGIVKILSIQMILEDIWHITFTAAQCKALVFMHLSRLLWEFPPFILAGTWYVYISPLAVILWCLISVPALRALFHLESARSYTHVMIWDIRLISSDTWCCDDRVRW